MTTTTLADRIAAVLECSGFTAWTPTASERKPAFTVTEGVGANVGLSWDAPASQRTPMLATYEAVLAGYGLTVDSRGNHLYVHEPATVKEDGR